MDGKQLRVEARNASRLRPGVAPMPSIDVAVPNYQYGRYLRDCVTSVLTQELPNLRILIIDNASTDNSLEVAQELAASDRRVQVVAHRTNLGPLASFNEGIDWASADYFMVLCADDLLATGSLARAVSVMAQHPEVNLTYGRALFIGAHEPIPAINHNTQEARWRILAGRDLLQRFCRTAWCDVFGPTALVRTSAQKGAGYYRSELPHTCDFEMWMRLACLGSVAETDTVQGIVRHHPANRSASVGNMGWYLQFDAAFESFFAKEGASAPEAKGLHQIARRTLGERAYWSAIANLLRGQNRLGLDLLKYAFFHSPATVVVPPLGILFRGGDTINKVARVISDAARRLSGPVREGRDIR
jgi:glycosyltransferase involved in cell wall biosynthesis